MKQLRMFPSTLLFLITVTLLLFAAQCGNNNENTTPTLPGGCQSQSVNAIAVLDSSITCLPTNAYTDPTKVLGPPDAGTTGQGKNEITGILSPGIDGWVTLYLGSCIQDLPGDDLRVYQVVSNEAVEVQVSQSQNGPFVSLGRKDCGTLGTIFERHCDFDLAGSGLNNVRIIKIFDREVFTFPGVACDNAGSSPGADLDAVEVLHPGG